MFTLDNIQYRNLEEQVQKNKEEIAKHWEVDRVLADFGITILGTKANASLLPSTAANYGDAYLVGENPPYDVYIWTRANPNAGHDSPYWINIGSIAVVGPQGPSGRSITNAGLTQDYQLRLTFSDGTIMNVPGGSLKGPRGENGKDGKNPRIQAVQTDNGANIITYDGDGNWTGVAQIFNGAPGESIVGPQGPAGTFNIRGILTSSNLLPLASDAAPGDSYLITSTTSTTHAYDLWVIVNAESDAAEWVNTGALSAGTVITEGGVPQTTFDADTKLNRITGGHTAYVAYIQTPEGTDAYIPITSGSLTPNSIAQRNAAGAVPVGEPTAYFHATPKQYVDNIQTNLQTAIDAKVPKFTHNLTYKSAILQQTTGGFEAMSVVGSSPVSNTIPVRQLGGALVVGEPTEASHAATKSYVDNAVANAGGGGGGVSFTQNMITAGELPWEYDSTMAGGVYKTDISSYIPSGAKFAFISISSSDGYCFSSRVWPLGYQVGDSAFDDGTLAIDYNDILYVKDTYQPSGYINIGFI